MTDDFATIKQETCVDVAGCLGRIEAFERVCQAGEYTETGDAWDLIEHVRGVLRDIAHQVNAYTGTPAEGAFDSVEEMLASVPKKIDKVCETCGSNEVSFEGWISWSVEKQEFEVDNICDKGHHCSKCDGTTYAIDVPYKPYCIEIEFEPGEGGAHESTQTYHFHTREEVKAFHEGMRKGAKIGEWEVAYTDEEDKCD